VAIPGIRTAAARVSIPLADNSSRFVTAEEVQQAAAEVQAVHSLKLMESTRKVIRGNGYFNTPADDYSLDEFTTHVFETLATVAFWHARPQEKDIRNGGSCIIC
jgi:hypothetical protein